MRVLDTDVCIAILRGDDGVMKRRTALVDSVATTWMTAAELLFGAEKSASVANSRTAVLAFLETLAVLAPGARAAAHYAGIRAELERRGRRIEDADMIVAAITMAHDAVLVSGNTRHFERIDGLRLENWLR